MKHGTIAVFALLLLLPSQANAACQWVPIRALETILKTRHQETPIHAGITIPGATLFQVYTSKHGRTWSAVIIRPNRWACIIAAGEWWMTHEQKMDDEPIAYE